MTVRAFDITFKDEAVQTVNLKAGTWTFHAFVNALTYSIGLKDSTGVWHNYDLSDQTGTGWYDVQETITTDFDAVEISLLNNAGTAQVLFPMLEKGSRKSVKRPHEKDIEEAAIIKSASREIHTSSPVIYKDAPDLTTDGAHTPVTVTGRHWVGSVMTEEGFLTVTANDETEAANASPSPVTIAPLNSADKHTYTIRLYSDANKTELLDYETIPVVFKGAKGISAIRLHINNPVDVLPADSDGNVLSFTGTGTSIHIFEGAVELDYDGIGTTNGKFKVTAVPSSVTMGAITDGGNICVVADATAMTAEKASIVYTVTGKTLDGFDFTVSGEQNFTKTNRGADGDGITGTTIEYAKDASGTTPPNNGWSVNLPTPTLGWYLWTRITTTYKVAASTVAYTISRWPNDGDPGTPGTPGKGVSSVVTWYYKSSSGTQLLDGAWSTTKPDYSDSFFLWTKTITTYTDSTTTETAPILDPDWHKVLAITDRFGFVVNGGLISPVRIDLREANSLEVTAGISGIQKSYVETYTEYEFGLSTVSATPPTVWQETPPARGAGYFLWMRYGTGSGGTKPTTWTNELIEEDGNVRYIELSNDQFTWHRMPYVAGNQYMRTVYNSVTSDVKKIINEGISEYLPALWAGGSYERAFAFIDFLRNYYNGTVQSATEYSNLAKIALIHNGAAKIGDFIIESSGRIVIVDPATGKVRLAFSKSNIPTSADILSATQYGNTVTNVSSMGTTSGMTILANGLSVTKDSSDLTFTGILSINAELDEMHGYTAGSAIVRVMLYKDDDYYTDLGSIGGTLDINYPTTSGAYTINSKMVVPIGNYTIVIQRTFINTITQSGGISNTSTFAWSFIKDIRRFEFGLDGFMSWYTDNHIHFTESAGLDIQGATNMPGVLLSATVASTGGWASVWGAKGSTTQPANNSTGKYTVYHTVGHTNYQVSAVSLTASKTCHIVSKGSDNFVIEWRTVASTPALANTGFDFQIIGNNYV